MSNLTSLSALCPVTGGLVCIEYAPADEVDASTYEEMADDSGGWKSNFSFVAGSGGWRKAPVLERPTFWQEAERAGEQGKYYESEVSALLPGNTPALLAELSRMRGHRYILRLADRDGKKYIAGTAEIPFEFASSLDAGVEASALKHIRLTWRRQSPRRAFGWNY